MVSAYSKKTHSFLPNIKSSQGSMLFKSPRPLLLLDEDISPNGVLMKARNLSNKHLTSAKVLHRSQNPSDGNFNFVSVGSEIRKWRQQQQKSVMQQLGCRDFFLKSSDTACSSIISPKWQKSKKFNQSPKNSDTDFVLDENLQRLRQMHRARAAIRAQQNGQLTQSKIPDLVVQVQENGENSPTAMMFSGSATSGVMQIPDKDHALFNCRSRANLSPAARWAELQQKSVSQLRGWNESQQKKSDVNLPAQTPPPLAAAGSPTLAQNDSLQSLYSSQGAPAQMETAEKDYLKEISSPNSQMSLAENRVFNLVYINLHEVHEFKMQVLGLGKFCSLAQTKHDQMSSSSIKEVLDKSDPFGKLTQLLRQKLDLKVFPRHFFDPDGRPITEFEQLACLKANSRIYVTVKPAFRHLYAEQQRQSIQRINKQKKEKDWEAMANLRLMVCGKNTDDSIVLNLNDMLKSAKQLQQDSSAKHVSPTRKVASIKKEKEVESPLSITKLKNPNTSRIQQLKPEYTMPKGFPFEPERETYVNQTLTTCQRDNTGPRNFIGLTVEENEYNQYDVDGVTSEEFVSEVTKIQKLLSRKDNSRVTNLMSTSRYNCSNSDLDSVMEGNKTTADELQPAQLTDKKHKRRISTMMVKRDRVNQKAPNPCGMFPPQPSIMHLRKKVLQNTQKLKKSKGTGNREMENRQGLIIRTKAALSSSIISKILCYYQHRVLDNSMYYEKKFSIERILFLKIFNLYTSMVFITVYTHCMELSDKQKAGFSGSDAICVNTMDVDRMVENAGVDLDIVKKNAFPQLMFENKMVIERMFDFVKGEIDLHTRLLPFEAFLRLVVQFNTKNVSQKIERFFKLIDTDNSGTLDYEEILDLCRRNLCTYQENNRRDEDEEFYEDLAKAFASSIFKCLDEEEEAELTVEQFHFAMDQDTQGAQILDMLCGESLIDMDAMPGMGKKKELPTLKNT